MVQIVLVNTTTNKVWVPTQANTKATVDLHKTKGWQFNFVPKCKYFLLDELIDTRNSCGRLLKNLLNTVYFSTILLSVKITF